LRTRGSVSATAEIRCQRHEISYVERIRCPIRGICSGLRYGWNIVSPS
jgi:hypothetical protein